MAVKDIEVEKKALAKEYKELLKISYQTLSGDDKKLITSIDDSIDTMAVVDSCGISSQSGGLKVSYAD